MMGVGVAALLANVAGLMLISRHRKGGVHMRASWICTTNDVIANLGVILSGALDSCWPDLAVGAIVSALVSLSELPHVLQFNPPR